MKEKYVVAYYGSVYSNQYTHTGWEKTYIGEGIVYESEAILTYPNKTFVEINAPQDKKFNYAKIEKRFYKV